MPLEIGNKGARKKMKVLKIKIERVFKQVLKGIRCPEFGIRKIAVFPYLTRKFVLFLPISKGSILKPPSVPHVRRLKSVSNLLNLNKISGTGKFNKNALQIIDNKQIAEKVKKSPVLVLGLFEILMELVITKELENGN